MTQWRLSGIFHHIGHLASAVCSGSTMELDATSSTVDHFLGLPSGSLLNITGSQDSLASDYALDGITVANTGTGNSISDNGFSYSYLNGVPVARRRAGTSTASTLTNPGLSRPAFAFARSHDFIDKGAANYFPNSEDLWFWPYELSCFGCSPQPTVIADPSSDSGACILVTSAAAQSVNTANAVEWSVGVQFPATQMRVYTKAKASTTISGWAWGVGYGGVSTNLCAGSANLTTSYQVFSCTIDTSSISGDQIAAYFPAPPSGDTVSVAWIAFRPFDTDTTTTSLIVGAGNAAITNSSALPTVGTPTAGQAACIKSAGSPVVIGYCSTVVSSSGACTCN
jgi:hypothetical protein